MTLTLNDLLTTVESFSEIACLDGRAFGVKSPCETCTMEFNRCLRERLVQNLLSNQGRVEEEVGYALTTRYHVEEVVWDGKPTRLQLQWPGVSAVNVIKSVTKLAGATTVSPFVILNAPTSDSGNGYVVVELDKLYVDNPGHAIIRNAVTNEIYQQQFIDGYPKRNGSNNWLVALAKTPVFGSFTVNVQHCQYMTVVRATPTCTGTIQAVKTGTTDVIPFAKSAVVSGGNTIYWFRPWSFVADQFRDELVDLSSGYPDFYKLMQDVEFICVTDSTSNPVVTQAELCDCDTALSTVSDLIRVEILFARESIVRISYLNNANCLNCKTPIKLKVFYKTDPYQVVDDASLLSLQEAIVYLTAAELPLSSCGCKLDSGFIADAQKVYSDIRVNPYTGETITNIRFNTAHGQMVFAERLDKAYKHRRLLTV